MYDFGFLQDLILLEHGFGLLLGLGQVHSSSAPLFKSIQSSKTIFRATIARYSPKSGLGAQTMREPWVTRSAFRG